MELKLVYRNIVAVIDIPHLLTGSSKEDTSPKHANLKSLTTSVTSK